MKYEATYSFNVRRHLRVEFEADDHEQAERIARDQAAQHVDAEIALIQNADGYSDTSPLDPILTLDVDEGPDGWQPVCEGESLAAELGEEDAANG